MNKINFLLWLLLAVIQNRSFAQGDTIFIKPGKYENVEDMRDSTLAEDFFRNRSPSLNDTCHNICLSDIVMEADLDIEELYYPIQKDKLLKLVIDRTVIKNNLGLSGYLLDIKLDKSEIKMLDIQSSIIQNVIITDCIIDTLKLDRSSIKNLVIRNGKIKYISLRECHDVTSLVLDDNVAMNMLDLSDFRPPKEGNVFVRINCSSFEDKDSSAVLFADSQTDFDKIEIDYHNFRIAYSDDGFGDTPDAIRSLYHRLLKKFEDNGRSDNYRRLFKHKRYYEASLIPHRSVINSIIYSIKFFFTYTIPDWWWGFGLEKQKIIRNTFILYLFSLLLGMATFKRIMTEYPVIIEDKELLKLYESNKLAKIYVPVIGITILFFGIEFKISKLRFQRMWASIAVLVIYGSGLICLAFLANLIITK